MSKSESPVETSGREPFTIPTTPAEKVAGMLVIGMRGIRDHDLDEYEWATDMVAALEELIASGRQNVSDVRKDAGEALRDIGKPATPDSEPSADVPAIPDVLFDGVEVYNAMDERAWSRTNPDNVADVLDAVVRILRAAPVPAPEPRKD